MITAIDTIRSVARSAAEHPPGPRAVPDPPATAGGPPAASLAGLLPRVARVLARLLFAHGRDGDCLRVLARAVTTFVPLLDLGWLPAHPGAAPKPDTRVEARIDLLRQERAARARLRSAAARHRPARPAPPGQIQRARPDRPPGNRGATILGFPWAAATDDGLWHELLDLTSELLEICLGFGHQGGVQSCAELLELLAAVFGEPRPKAA